MFRNGCNKSASTVEGDNIEVIDGEDHSGHDHSGHGHGGAWTYTINGAGDLLDKAGNVVHRAGSYMLDGAGNLVDKAGNVITRAVDIPKELVGKLKVLSSNTKGSTEVHAGPRLVVNANGDLVDESGKVMYKKGDFQVKDGYYVDKDGNRIGKFFKKVGEAIGDAAEATADAFKKLFSGMVKKEEGAKRNYILSDIRFNNENHRIETFSKAEVEGLAAALKDNPGGKITVAVYTNDGENDKENAALSKTRAEVVRDMLVTLGVKKGQIVAEGMGSKDAVKASGDKVEINVK